MCPTVLDRWSFLRAASTEEPQQPIVYGVDSGVGPRNQESREPNIS